MAKGSAACWIRPALAADQAGVLRCLEVAFKPYRGDYTSQAFADTVLDSAGYLERLRKMHVLVAVSLSEIVGTVAGEFTGTRGHLRGMAVLDEWKGTGLAARLLRNLAANAGLHPSNAGYDASTQGCDLFL